MLEAAALTLVAVILAIAMRAAVEAGGRWIDRALCGPPLDPNKPIVRQSPQGRETERQDG